MTTHALAELRDAMAVALYSHGYTRGEVASVMGCSYYTLPAGSRGRSAVQESRDAIERAKDFVLRYKRGETMEHIGSVYGVSRARVQQILFKCGVTRKDGGNAIIKGLRNKDAEERRNATSMRRHGCTHAQYQSLRAIQRATVKGSRGPITAFQIQRCNAAARGVEWNLTLWQWWTAWQESGKWEQRGREKGQYVMSRIGDQGAYEVGNIRIILCSENITEGYESTPAAKRCELRGCRRDAQGMTVREAEIFPFVKQGFSPRQIAEHFGISRVTASQYALHLRRRYPDAQA
jgi:hypothetical protein